MAKDEPNWNGLLKWSLSHADGTLPPRTLSEEDRRWFTEAMRSMTVDVVGRMKDITAVMKTPEQVLESQGVTPQNLEDMLDELQEHVESIDMANDLHTIGGLVPLISCLKNVHANIRAKSAEVISTIVQNNPKTQRLVMDANGLEPLLNNFAEDPDVTVRTKALGAISSLIKNNEPGITSFRCANGYAILRDALSSENFKFQRKALNLVGYLLNEKVSDRRIAVELGFPRILVNLVSSEDAEVREAALRGLLELSRDGNDGKSKDEKLKEVLLERIKGISEMSLEDLGAVMEERRLVDAIWRACYNEPSSLKEKGLLVLPGEDTPPSPDFGSKLFEPPLRSWSGSRDDDYRASSPPLILGGPVSSANSGSGK